MKLARKAAAGLVVAAALLLAVELVLRTLGVAAPEPFFLPAEDLDGGAWMVTNPRVGDNWFHGAEWEDAVRRPRWERFEVDKPEDVYRVFVLGESAAYGTPLDDNATWPSQLEHILGAAQDQQRVEVINLALRAVSADIYLDVLPELHRFEPDLLVVYAGHNEHYGVRRAGWLRRLRMVRALHGLREARPVPASMSERVGVRAEDRILAHSEEATRVVQRFATTLDALVRGAGGVPLLVYAPQANLRELAPLCSEPIEGEPEGAQRAAELLWLAGVDLEGVLDLGEVTNLAAHHPRHAGLRWLVGWHLLGSDGYAWEDFRRARDLDCLPVRASDAILEVIHELPERHPQAPVLEVDPLPQLMKAEGGQLMGHDAFHDHVHLTIRGSYAVARAGAEAIAADPGRFGLALDPAAIPDEAGTLAALGVAPVDAWLNLMRSEIFYERSIVRDVATRPHSVAHFQRERAAIEAQLEPVVLAALDEWAPLDPDFHSVLALEYARRGMDAAALASTHRAVLARPGCGPCRVELARGLSERGYARTAREHALVAVMLGVSDWEVGPLLGATLEP